MSKEKKIKKLKKSQNNSYRLAVMKEDSYQEKFALSLSKRNIFLITFSITFFIILITSLIIFYTPIREYIPGYDTSKIRSQAIKNLEKIDSLMTSLQKNEQFMESFSNTLQGKRFDNKYENNSLNKEIDLSELEINIRIEDSILRSIVESEDKFNVIENENNQISMDLIAPANGFISEGFNLANKHYGVDIVLKQRSSVKAISEGIVLFSDWTLSTGYNVVIYHKNKLVSIYKHNESVKVEKGDFVQSGQIIALSGNTGELTTGPHLHLEIWDSQGPLNPENLIKF